MTTLRVPFALASGFLLSLAGFFGLVLLIGAPLEVGERVTPRDVTFTPQRRTIPPISKREPKVVREPPPLAPTTPRIGGESVDETVGTFRPQLIKVVAPHGGGGLPIGVDRDAIPIVRINPTYPPREQARGIEGWVQVRFTVTATGTVRDAIVVDSEPKSVFDAAALEAIGRWRYNPRVDGGVAVERVGLQTIIRFKLENGA